MPGKTFCPLGNLSPPPNPNLCCCTPLFSQSYSHVNFVDIAAMARTHTPRRSALPWQRALAAVLILFAHNCQAQTSSFTVDESRKLIALDWDFFGATALPSCSENTFLVRGARRGTRLALLCAPPALLAGQPVVAITGTASAAGARRRRHDGRRPHRARAAHRTQGCPWAGL